MAEPRTAAIVPYPSSDPLYVHALEDGLKCYVLGYYQAALDRFRDAAAIVPHRVDRHIWLTIASQLESLLVEETLSERNHPVLAEQQVRR